MILKQERDADEVMQSSMSQSFKVEAPKYVTRLVWHLDWLFCFDDADLTWPKYLSRIPGH